MMDFLVMLLTAPVVLPWWLLVGASLALLLAMWSIAYVVALIHARTGESWKGLLVTTTRVTVSWIWGWSSACLALLLYAAVLTYLDRIPSWLAALPYLTSALIAIGIAAWLRHKVRLKVVTLQRLVQGGRS